MGKGWIGVAAVLAGALALQGCGRGRDAGGDQTSVETQVAPPMANVVAPPAPKPPPAKPAVTVPSAAATSPEAQVIEDAAAVGMTSRTGGGGYSIPGPTPTAPTTRSTTSGETPPSPAPN